MKAVNFGLVIVAFLSACDQTQASKSDPAPVVDFHSADWRAVGYETDKGIDPTATVYSINAHDGRVCEQFFFNVAIKGVPTREVQVTCSDAKE